VTFHEVNFKNDTSDIQRSHIHTPGILSPSKKIQQIEMIPETLGNSSQNTWLICD
jgi:hypothetical protein